MRLRKANVFLIQRVTPLFHSGSNATSRKSVSVGWVELLLDQVFGLNRFLYLLRGGTVTAIQEMEHYLGLAVTREVSLTSN